MAGEINDQRGEAYYTKFYKTGGWKYSLWREYWWHRRHIVQRFKLRRGMKMLEVACGCGFHTDLFSKMGFDCTGIDRSAAGVAWAKAHYPKRSYIQQDLRNLSLPPASFDAIFARGCSHYHYDLLDAIPLATSKSLLGLLKPGGVFIMTIITNLSGHNKPDAVWNNTLNDYRKHFSSFGKRWSVDWTKGMAICGLYNEPMATSDPTESASPVALCPPPRLSAAASTSS